MDNRLLKLEEFIAEYPFWGKWVVSYTDETHLEKSEYVKLGNITIDGTQETTRDHPILPFIFEPATAQEIKCRFSEFPQGKQQADHATRVILNQLTDSMLRTGLLRPQFCLMDKQAIELRFLEVMRQLSNPGHLTLIADTSALRRAVISFLHKTLSNTPIWTVVPIFVMTEIQQQIYKVNKIWDDSNSGMKPHLAKHRVLEKRPQVSCISRELNHIRLWRPVEILTSIPENPDQFNIDSKIDRLIIESMKYFKQNRGLQQGVYLLTGDKDMASLATLENQSSLHIRVPSMTTEMSSVRYDSYNRKWLLSPVHHLLWDLAQVFSTIRLENQELSRIYKLVYYSQTGGGFFARDVMEIWEE